MSIQTINRTTVATNDVANAAYNGITLMCLGSVAASAITFVVTRNPLTAISAGRIATNIGIMATIANVWRVNRKY